MAVDEALLPMAPKEQSFDDVQCPSDWRPDFIAFKVGLTNVLHLVKDKAKHVVLFPVGIYGVLIFE
jgi:hypothetical protein